MYDPNHPHHHHHLHGSTKWLIPHQPPPAGKVLALGSILTDPENPLSSINCRAGLCWAPEIHHHGNHDHTAPLIKGIEHELVNNREVLHQAVLPTNPLGKAAACLLESTLPSDMPAILNALNVTAAVFHPPTAYMRRALNEENVLKHHTKFNALYVVVGIATSGRLDWSEARSKEERRRFDEERAQRQRSGIANGLTHDSAIAIADDIEQAAVAFADQVCRMQPKLGIVQSYDVAYRVREFKYKVVDTMHEKEDGDWLESEGSTVSSGDDDDHEFLEFEHFFKDDYHPKNLHWLEL